MIQTHYILHKTCQNASNRSLTVEKKPSYDNIQSYKLSIEIIISQTKKKQWTFLKTLCHIGHANSKASLPKSSIVKYLKKQKIALGNTKHIEVIFTTIKCNISVNFSASWMASLYLATISGSSLAQTMKIKKRSRSKYNNNI